MTLYSKFRIFCCVVSVGIIIPLLSHAAPSKKELEEMEKKVRLENIEHRKLQAEATKISIELASISEEMVKAARLVQNNEDKISKMEVELDVLKKELKEAESDFTKEDDNLIRTLAALQNLALRPTEALFVQPLTPVEIIRSAMLMREAVPFLEENANKLREKLLKIEAKKKLVESQVQKIVDQKKVLESEHGKMKELVQKKSKVRSAVEIKSQQAKQRVENLATQAKDLRELLDKLDIERKIREKKAAEERKRLAELRALQEEEAKKTEETESVDLIKLKPEFITEIGAEFVKAKGRLLMPARGQIKTLFGDETAKGVKSKGIIIKTRDLAQVIAPFDGSVIFAGEFRGYGNMLIIDHGKGYLSLLAGLEGIDCELGQMLLAGEPVGQMPKSGDARLYVEIRKDNNPVDPLGWFAN